MADDQTYDNTANDLDDTAQSEGESQVQPQSEDNDTPFSPPTDSANDSSLDDTHPVTDTNVDSHEEYDEGTPGAAEAEEPDQPRGNA